jgi:hypothetical protein
MIHSPLVTPTCQPFGEARYGGNVRPRSGGPGLGTGLSHPPPPPGSPASARPAPPSVPLATGASPFRHRPTSSGSAAWPPDRTRHASRTPIASAPRDGRPASSHRGRGRRPTRCPASPSACAPRGHPLAGGRRPGRSRGDGGGGGIVGHLRMLAERHRRAPRAAAGPLARRRRKAYSSHLLSDGRSLEVPHFGPLDAWDPGGMASQPCPCPPEERVRCDPSPLPPVAAHSTALVMHASRNVLLEGRATPGRAANGPWCRRPGAPK